MLVLALSPGKKVRSSTEGSFCDRRGLPEAVFFRSSSPRIGPGPLDSSALARPSNNLPVISATVVMTAAIPQRPGQREPMTPPTAGQVGTRPRRLRTFSIGASRQWSFPGNGQVVDPGHRHLNTIEITTTHACGRPYVRVRRELRSPSPSKRSSISSISNRRCVVCIQRRAYIGSSLRVTIPTAGRAKFQCSPTNHCHPASTHDCPSNKPLIAC